ncbi:MAG: hypothetical protein R2712_07530 [Vicinamibacterales bacterium]
MGPARGRPCPHRLRPGGQGSSGEVQASIPTGSAAPIFTFEAPNGSFYIRIHSLDGTAKSAASNETQPSWSCPSPAPPANLVSLVNGPDSLLAPRNNFGGGEPAFARARCVGRSRASLPLPRSDSFAFSGRAPRAPTRCSQRRERRGRSAPSAPVTLTFPGACSGPPQPPVGFVSYREGSTIHTLWGPSPAGPAPTRYLVNVGGAFVGSFGTTGRALSGAAGPGTYEITIVSVNACGPSAPTSVRSVTIP